MYINSIDFVVLIEIKLYLHVFQLDNLNPDSHSTPLTFICMI